MPATEETNHWQSTFNEAGHVIGRTILENDQATFKEYNIKWKTEFKMVLKDKLKFL